MKIFISIFFAIIPILAFFIQRHFSKKENNIQGFKLHWTVYYGDWIFIPFNIILVYSVIINNKTLLPIILISFILNILMHIYWGRINKKVNGILYFYKKGEDNITKAGIIHLLFSTFQMSLILIFIFSMYQNIILFVIESILLIIFSVLLLIGSKKISGKIRIYDLIPSILLLLSICISLFINFKIK